MFGGLSIANNSRIEINIPLNKQQMGIQYPVSIRQSRNFVRTNSLT